MGVFGSLKLKQRSSEPWPAKFTGPTKAANASDARFAKNQKMSDVRRGEGVPAPAGEATIGELLRDYLAQVRAHCKPLSVLWVENKLNAVLLPFFDKFRASTLTTRDLNVWREKRLSGSLRVGDTCLERVVDTTVNRDMAILRAAYNLGRKQTPSRSFQ